MRKLFAVLLYGLTLPLFAAQLIIEPEMGRAPLLNAIRNAHQSIQLVMYGFTDQALLDALLDKHHSKQTVQIILEERPYKNEQQNQKIIRQLNQAHIKWQGRVPPYALIHEKALILDGKKAFVLTFNFTASAFKNQRNFALVLDDAKTVHDIAAIFSADWHHLPAQTSQNILLSPDDSRKKLSKLIQQAKHSIKIYAQSIKDYQTAGLLAKAAKKGVSVQILTSASLSGKQSRYLARSGVWLKQSHHYYIHAKVMIIDDRLAVIGSLNLTRPSFDHNRELAVITKDSQIIRQLNQTFTQDWQVN